MIATNIISAYQGIIALNSIGEASGKIVKEAGSLRKLCNEFNKNNADFRIFVDTI